MATETHVTRSDRYGNNLTHVKSSNNPARKGTYFSQPAAQPSVHSTMGPPANKTRRSIAVKAATKTPVGRTVKTASRVAPKLKKPNLSLPSSDKRTTPALNKAVNHSPILLAEFLIALLLIGGKGISGIAQNGYQNTISGVMLRFSGVTALWFVLFLFSSSKRGSTFAAWFGALVLLGILYDAVNDGSVANLTSMVQGKGISSSGSTMLISSEKPDEFYQTSESSGQKPPTGGQSV